MILAVDPGLDGALAWLDPAAPGEVAIADMPTLRLARRREIDVQALAVLLGSPLEHAFVERAGSRPAQGVASSFQTGKGFGLILGILAARLIPYTLVTAVKWKRALSVPKAKDGAIRSPSHRGARLPSAHPAKPVRISRRRADATGRLQLLVRRVTL
jgi:hypothetical protein